MMHGGARMGRKSVEDAFPGVGSSVSPLALPSISCQRSVRGVRPAAVPATAKGIPIGVAPNGLRRCECRLSAAGRRSGFPSLPFFDPWSPFARLSPAPARL
jgi:hypothetical protein